MRRPSGTGEVKRLRGMRLRSWLAVSLVVAGSVVLWGQESGVRARIPPVHGVTFAGRAVDLPGALQGKIGVLVVGFSKASSEMVAGWGKRLIDDPQREPGLVFYEMPMLEGVPKLLRGVVTGTIRSSVAEAARPYFLPLTEHEADWRRLAGYKEPDDAYVLVVDGQGGVRWQTHGAVTDAAYGMLKQQVALLEAKR